MAYLTSYQFKGVELNDGINFAVPMADQTLDDLNSADATRLGLAESDRVKISNSRGAVTTVVKIRDRVPQGVVWFPEHFDGEAKQLAEWAIDPRTQIPYFKLAQVTLAKVS